MNNPTPLRAFLRWEKETPQNVFLRQPIHDQWHSYTYQQAGLEIRKVAASLQKLNLPPKSNIAILSKNCAHWIMTDLAIMMAGYVSVPVYPTLSAAGINQILVHSECKVIVIGKLDNYESQRGGIPELLVKICFPMYGIQEGLGWDKIQKECEPFTEGGTDPEAIYSIMYSSGTTGTPKGVMLTGGAFGFVGDAVSKHLGIKKPERFFSYLPLSHIAERALVEMVAIASGSTISFAESLEKFQQNLQHEQPTMFGGVPRIYQKFQEGILAKLPQPKLNMLLAIPLVSSLIKKTIRKKLGLAEARIIVCGAAPTPVTLLRWFKKIGIEIGEMYGMTENTAFSHANYNKIKIGTVGQGWPEAEIKLSEEGEVLTRHPALMRGYFKDAETTARVFTADGYLKTGDMGEIDSEGFLTITGRLKDQFKTDKAKFIAPAPIELRLLANADIEQVCVVGMGIPQPIALIILSETARKKPKAEIIESLTKTIEAINPSLESYERLEKAVIMRDLWTIENGLLTPSLKLKRNELEKIHLPKYPDWYRNEAMVVWE